MLGVGERIQDAGLVHVLGEKLFQLVATRWIGFALKPHFLAIPVLVELCVALGRAREMGWPAARRASLRDPVPWSMALVWAAYAASLPLLFPQYLNFVVPLVWAVHVVPPSTVFSIIPLMPAAYPVFASVKKTENFSRFIFNL